MEIQGFREPFKTLFLGTMPKIEIWICVLVNECLGFCVGEGMLGFVAAPGVNTARVGWHLQSGFVYW